MVLLLLLLLLLLLFSARVRVGTETPTRATVIEVLDRDLNTKRNKRAQAEEPKQSTMKRELGMLHIMARTEVVTKIGMKIDMKVVTQNVTENNNQR